MVKRTDHRDYQIHAPVAKHDVAKHDPATKVLKYTTLSPVSARDIIRANVQLPYCAEYVSRVLLNDEPVTTVYCEQSSGNTKLAYSYYLRDCQLLAMAYLLQCYKKPAPAPTPVQTITLDILKARNFTVVSDGDQGDLSVLVNPRYAGYFRLVGVGPISDGQFTKSQLHWHRPWIRRQPSIIFTSVNELDDVLSRHYLVTSSREEMPWFDNDATMPLSLSVLKQLGFYQFLRSIEHQHRLFVHSAALGWFELNEVRSINSVKQLSLTWINTADVGVPVLAQVWTTAQLLDLVKLFYRVKQNPVDAMRADVDRKFADRVAKLLKE